MDHWLAADGCAAVGAGAACAAAFARAALSISSRAILRFSMSSTAVGDGRTAALAPLAARNAGTNATADVMSVRRVGHAHEGMSSCSHSTRVVLRQGPAPCAAPHAPHVEVAVARAAPPRRRPRERLRRVGGEAWRGGGGWRGGEGARRQRTTRDDGVGHALGAITLGISRVDGEAARGARRPRARAVSSAPSRRDGRGDGAAEDLRAVHGGSVGASGGGATGSV